MKIFGSDASLLSNRRVGLCAVLVRRFLFCREQGRNGALPTLNKWFKFYFLIFYFYGTSIFIPSTLARIFLASAKCSTPSGYLPEVNPPSIVSTVALNPAALSESRNRIVSTTSWTSSALPNGTLAKAASAFLSK
jgi:hypothetical protein